ncbi:MAG: hypothetical protein MZV70_67545 [Desulfobacterales bacterium]|nr:hypothetical protein [Desulfobacterales bacterium]
MTGSPSRIIFKPPAPGRSHPAAAGHHRWPGKSWAGSPVSSFPRVWRRPSPTSGQMI